MTDPTTTQTSTRPTVDQLKATFSLLAEKRALLLALDNEHNQKREAILDKVRAELEALDNELYPARNAAASAAAIAETAAKQLVIEYGESFKYAGWHMVYTPPKPVWDAAALDGFAVAHPELFTLRTLSEPKVALRPDKKSEKLIA